MRRIGGFALAVRSLGTRQVSGAFYLFRVTVDPSKVDIDVNIDII